jgi:hypothetical protein
LRLTNLSTTEVVAEVLPQLDIPNTPVAGLTVKPVQDRFVGIPADAGTSSKTSKSTKTAEALARTGGIVKTAPGK